MSLSSLTISSIVFLVLYFTLLLVLIAGYLTKRIKLRSRYTLVLFHVTLRVAAQGVGIGFGVKGFEESGLLIGYLILAAGESWVVTNGLGISTFTPSSIDSTLSSLNLH